MTKETKLGMFLMGLAHLGRAAAVAFAPAPGGAEHALQGHEGHDHGPGMHNHGPGRCPSCGKAHGPGGCPHCGKKKAAVAR